MDSHAVLGLGFKKIIDMPPFWLLGLAALAYFLGALLTPWGAPAVIRWLGWLALLAGAGLMAAAIIEFRRKGTTVIPHAEPTHLVTTGVYQYSRNPIYLADALILAGLCLIWGAWAGLLLVPVFVVLIEKRFIQPEEARLRAGFGAEFAAWAGRTRRWI